MRRRMPTTTGLQWQFVDARDALKQDTKLNAAKAIVAERLDKAVAMIVDCAKTKHRTILMPKLVDDAEAALTAWRELTGSRE